MLMKCKKSRLGYGERIKNTNDQVRILSRDIVWKSRDCNSIRERYGFMPSLIFASYFLLLFLLIKQYKKKS